jgi:hypothetical protein
LGEAQWVLPLPQRFFSARELKLTPLLPFCIATVVMLQRRRDRSVLQQNPRLARCCDARAGRDSIASTAPDCRFSALRKLHRKNL